MHEWSERKKARKINMKGKEGEASEGRDKEENVLYQTNTHIHTKS
jgi:hypothetical protein